MAVSAPLSSPLGATPVASHQGYFNMKRCASCPHIMSWDTTRTGLPPSLVTYGSRASLEPGVMASLGNPSMTGPSPPLSPPLSSLPASDSRLCTTSFLEAPREPDVECGSRRACVDASAVEPPCHPSLKRAVAVGLRRGAPSLQFPLSLARLCVFFRPLEPFRGMLCGWAGTQRPNLSRRSGTQAGCYARF